MWRKEGTNGGGGGFWGEEGGKVWGLCWPFACWSFGGRARESGWAFVAIVTVMSLPPTHPCAPPNRLSFVPQTNIFSFIQMCKIHNDEMGDLNTKSSVWKLCRWFYHWLIQKAGPSCHPNYPLNFICMGVGWMVAWLFAISKQFSLPEILLVDEFIWSAF